MRRTRGPGIEPGKSTREQVYDVMGKQPESEFRQSYIWYEKDDWKIIVYIYTENDQCPEIYRGRVQSIDFIPKLPVSFKDVVFNDNYRKHWGQGFDAAWWEYHDAHGLVYCIYTTNPPFGEATAGDLNRISYRSTPEAVIRMQEALLKNKAQDQAKKKVE